MSISLLVPLLATALAVAQESPPDPLPEADAAITRRELEHHVRFLASDELEGRAVFSPGSMRAAQYLARALQAAGVEPVGDDGTFLQKLDLCRYEYPTAPKLLCKNESGEVTEAVYGQDFELDMHGSATSTKSLELRCFYDYNYKRLPQHGNPDQAVLFSASRAERKKMLASLGIEDLGDWGLEVDVVNGEDGFLAGKVKDPPIPRIVSGSEPEKCERVRFRGRMRRAFEEGKFTHFELVIDQVRSPETAANVIGRIRGVGTKEHPELAQEVVLLSAHYDHLGIRHQRNGQARGDVICNGADDDASGCAALLELAQAFAAGEKPARTILILFTTGEERGGTGVKRYLAGPTEPLAKTVADLNLEMLGRPDPLIGGSGQLWLAGDERSNLGTAWRELGLPIHGDPRPKEQFFQRSDNYSLAIEGVVAQTLSSFNLHEEYHTPRDEADTLDYGHLEAAARVAQSAAATLASGALKPAWREGMQPRKLNKGPGAQAGAHGEGADEGRSACEGAKDGDEEDEDG